MTWLLYLLRVIAAMLLFVSMLSAIESNEWWIRIWDFPRLQILAAILLVAVLLAWLDREWRWRWTAVIALVAAAGWQFYRIAPYTPLWANETAFADQAAMGEGQCFTTLSLNVLQDNRDYARTAALIQRERPDILILLETDRKWADALEPVLSGYRHRLDRPLDNTYGLMFATNLPMQRGWIDNIAEPDTPSVFALLEAGQPFWLVGLHPRPPHPGQDTDERDAEIAIAARRAAAQPLPVLATGDFNDVAWSHTSRLFKRIGGYLDPRIGRGPYPTFPADWPFLRWPLDHLFHTPDFVVRGLSVLEPVGSDHLPIRGELCLAPRAAQERNAAPDRMTEEDVEDTAEIMDEYREDKAEDRANGK